MLPRKTIGVEQTGEYQVEHTTTDYRPLITYIVFALFTTAAIVAAEVMK